MTAMWQWLETTRAARESRGLARTARVRVEGTGGLDGSAGSDGLGGLVDLASNDYLGMARDPRVVAAGLSALRTYGAGARASRVVTGTLPPHEEAERALCELTGQESALVLASGYAANIAVVTALGGPGTLLVTDEHIHASVHDAARLSRSPRVTTPHGDVEAVEAALAARAEPRALVVVESIYSVLGDAADLPALAAVCARHDALLLVDEAHGIGVVGDGRGGVHAAGLAGHDHVILTATLSKAVGAQGGAVLGLARLRRHLVDVARAFIFDTGLAPASAAAAARACRIIADEPERVAGIARRAGIVAQTCGVPQAAGAVQSLPMRSPEAAVAATAELEARGVLVGCFRPPSVPDGVSRLRLCADAGLDVEAVTRAAELVARVADAHGRANPPATESTRGAPDGASGVEFRGEATVLEPAGPRP